MIFDVTLEGVAELEAEWADANATLGKDMRAVTYVGAKEGAAFVRGAHSYKDRTGTLTESIEGGIVSWTARSATGEIVARAKYASYVEEGTRPHPIDPKKKRVLAWENPDAQRDWHFAGHVDHPGTPAQPFMHRAAIKAEFVMKEHAEAAAEVAARRMNK